MADIFISYSQEHPAHTKALAADLEGRGYTTWWDTSLLPGDKYGKLIEHEIDQAKVIIVIWTAESVGSDWVRAEAKRGHKGNKLVTLYVPGFDLDSIPLPYNVLHCVPVTDGEALYKTLLSRGVMPKAAGQPQNLDSSHDAEALFQRGEDHFSGRNGIAENDGQAVSYYRRAAALGHSGAITKLGIMYQDGRGVIRDDAEALRLYRQAAEMGHPLAARQLGAMYETGRGVEANQEEARRWYLRAAESGDRFAFRAWRRLGRPWLLSRYKRRHPPQPPSTEAKPVGESGEEQS
jgi:hypothetical protein